MSANEEKDLGACMALPCEFCPQIVRRFKGFHRVLDTCAGIGTVAIALAKAGHEAIGVEPHEGRFRAARNNAEQARVAVEWINGDVLAADVLTKIGKIDAAFLDPNWKRDHSKKPPTVALDRMEPPLDKLLATIRPRTENMALRLPKETNLTEFHKLGGCFYEIEDCYLDNQLKFYMIYFGALAHHAEHRAWARCRSASTCEQG